MDENFYPLLEPKMQEINKYFEEQRKHEKLWDDIFNFSETLDQQKDKG